MKININCARATAGGTIQPGIDVALISRSAFAGCTGSGGSVTLTQVGNWSFHTPLAASPALETTAGHLDDVELKWQNTANPAICKFTIRGTGIAGKGLAETRFNELTQSLAVSETGFTGNLRVQNVQGCGGQFQNGNPVDLSVSLAVTATGGAVNVTS